MGGRCIEQPGKHVRLHEKEDWDQRGGGNTRDKLKIKMGGRKRRDETTSSVCRRVVSLRAYQLSAFAYADILQEMLEVEVKVEGEVLVPEYEILDTRGSKRGQV